MGGLGVPGAVGEEVYYGWAPDV